ncbi:RNGTT [Cordylochernes scorpioides]|uniref:mRNA guanylyltransferase n=1 Tax=Cordylochernes scorpioides TaxID=51811 RepID=A0ABY6K4B9_9ARAC|nr:RNGTT [Cordylochernes scorpioides]
MPCAAAPNMEYKHCSSCIPGLEALTGYYQLGQLNPVHMVQAMIIMDLRMQDRRKRKHQDFIIPPRWLKCPRFVPFKTPLDESYNDQVQEAKRFNPEMMLDFYKDSLGLWIDLTNTTRFYNQAVVACQNVKYVKIQCRGHGTCPSEEQTRTFIELVENFSLKHPDKLVGVHCTHGFNRTGFLIISYLVESLSWSIESAVTAFSQMLQKAFKDDCISRSQSEKWHKAFKEGREEVADEPRSGRPTTARTDENVDRVLDKELRVLRCQELLDLIQNEPDFLNSVVTGDESWMFEYDPESKRQSCAWHTKSSPRPKKARMSKSRIKTMIIVFFDIRGIVHCEFVPQGQTVNSAFYLEVLRRLKRRIARVRTDIKDTVKLHHDNATSHTAFIITNFLARSNTPVIPHLPYSPDLAPCDFFLFPKLKREMKGKHWETVENIQHHVTTFLRSIPVEEFQGAFQAWQTRLRKCIDAGGMDKEDVETSFLGVYIQARPPGIYKQDYLQELFQRYGDVDDTPPAPPLPDWCLEEEEKSDEEREVESYQAGNSSRPSKRRKKNRENSKKNPTFMAGVPGVSPVEDMSKVSAIHRKIKEWCEWRGSGFPGSQPVSMDINNVTNLSDSQYMVSWKADGTRYMMLIDGEDEIYFIDRDNSIFQITGLTFVFRKDLSQHLNATLVDGEMIIDKVNGMDVPRYLIYDIIKFSGKDVGKTHFTRRLHCIRAELIQPRHEAMKNGIIIREREPFSIRIKEFWEIPWAGKLLDSKFTEQLAHEIDGLIFQPVQTPYQAGTCNTVLKWKPQDMNSVDFKLIISKETREGMIPTSRGLLYLGGFDRPIAEIKVTRALKPYHNKIIECKLENNEWKFMRERTDKSFPNAYKTYLCK